MPRYLRRRRRHIAAALWAVFLCLGIPAAAVAARVPCGDGAAIIAHLEKDWGEDPTVMALDSQGRMVRILVNPETGSWTMLVTGAGERTCLVAHGEAWETLAPAPGDPS